MKNNQYALFALAAGLVACDQLPVNKDADLNQVSLSGDTVTLVIENRQTHKVDTSYYQILSTRFEDNFDADSTDVLHLRTSKIPEHTGLSSGGGEYRPMTLISHERNAEGIVETSLHISSEEPALVAEFNEKLAAFNDEKISQTHQNFVQPHGKGVSLAAADSFNGIYLKKIDKNTF